MTRLSARRALRPAGDMAHVCKGRINKMLPLPLAPLVPCSAPAARYAVAGGARKSPGMELGEASAGGDTDHDDEVKAIATIEDDLAFNEHKSGTAASPTLAQPARLRALDNGECECDHEFEALQLNLQDRHSMIELHRVKMLWAKALWYATQEARRRKTKRVADLKLARKNEQSGVRMRSTVAMVQVSLLHQNYSARYGCIPSLLT